MLTQAYSATCRRERATHAGLKILRTFMLRGEKTELDRHGGRYRRLRSGGGVPIRGELSSTQDTSEMANITRDV